jgi:hypothetical protein
MYAKHSVIGEQAAISVLETMLKWKFDIGTL